MSSDEPTFTALVSPGSRLHFAWGLGSELRLLDIVDPNTQQGGDGGFATLVSWGQATSSERSISFGTAEQYAEVQRARLTGTRDDAHLARVASYARSVREQLMSLSARDDSDEGMSQLEALLWQLLEVFFVDAPRNEGNLGEDLVHWLAAHHDSLANMTAQPTLTGRIQELQQDPNADAQPDYWAEVRRLVALGRTAEALQLLDCNRIKQMAAAGAAAMQQPGISAQLELLDCLHVLIKRLPRLAPSCGRDPTSRAYTSLAEFAAARSVWLRQARDMLDREPLFTAAAAANKRTADGVRSVLQVLQGQPAALRSATQDWLENAAAEVVHRQAGGVVAANQLRALLAEVRAGRPREESSNGLLELLQRLLEALTETDIAGVISVLTTSGVVSAWLLAHSLELMAAYPGAAAAGGAGGGGGAEGAGGGGGLLTRRLAVSGCDQMEYFRLAWAETLLPGCMSGGWDLALQYLAWCPQHGAAAAEALMEALPVDSRDVRGIEKALAACRRLGLGASAAVLCRVAGVDALCRGQLGSGAQWMVRAHDPRRAAAALQPVVAAVEEALLGRLGTYVPGPLVVPGGEELMTLLEWLPGGSGAGEELPAAAGVPEGDGRRGVTAFLVDVLRLSRAMGAVATALEAAASPDDAPSTSTSGTQPPLAAARAALMSMVRRRSAPRRLCLPLLFYALPLLECTAGGTTPFSSQDVHHLMCWAKECARAAAAVAGGAGSLTLLAPSAASAAASRDLGALAVSLGVAERYARDIQLALLRAVARSHVLEHSGSAARAGTGTAPSGVVGVGAGTFLGGAVPEAMGLLGPAPPRFMLTLGGRA